MATSWDPNYQNVSHQIGNFMKQVHDTAAHTPVDEKTIDTAQAALNHYITHAQNLKRPSLQILSNFSALLFKLYSSKMELIQKDDIKNFEQVSEKVNQAVLSTISFFLPQEGEQTSKKVIMCIYETMLNSILSDVHEEVIGQERPPKAFETMINEALKKEFGKDMELTPQLKKIAAELYPIAILTAYFHPNAKIPKTNNESEMLKHDLAQFKREYSTQFEKDISPMWIRNFSEVLKGVWNIKRTQQAKNL